MGSEFIVKRPVQSSTYVQISTDAPFELESFGWGILAGGILVVAAEGVILYFTWPVILPFLKGLGLGGIL